MGAWLERRGVLFGAGAVVWLLLLATPWLSRWQWGWDGYLILAPLVFLGLGVWRASGTLLMVLVPLSMAGVAVTDVDTYVAKTHDPLSFVVIGGAFLVYLLSTLRVLRWPHMPPMVDQATTGVVSIETTSRPEGRLVRRFALMVVMGLVVAVVLVDFSDSVALDALTRLGPAKGPAAIAGVLLAFFAAVVTVFLLAMGRGKQ